MADKKYVSRGFRITAKADEIIREVSKRDFREWATIARLSVLEYVEKRHPDLYEPLAKEFTPQ
jgi:hypothetical protein